MDPIWKGEKALDLPRFPAREHPIPLTAFFPKKKNGQEKFISQL